MTFYDAHNHLQALRIHSQWNDILATLKSQPIGRMVVNCSCEKDWPAVMELARAHPQVIPSFGCHPWHVKERTPRWKEALVECLDAIPSGIGEIGLDRYVKDYDAPAQEEAFLWQFRLAAERELPVTLHCLRAWGWLLELLETERRPARGFLLHSYGGSVEIIPELVKLGAYFSLPGVFAHENKARQREAFRRVPIDRLLIETDAPYQLPPPEWIRFPLPDRLNHPANLGAVYEFAAQTLGCSMEDLSRQVEENFHRFFGKGACVAGTSKTSSPK